MSAPVPPTETSDPPIDPAAAQQSVTDWEAEARKWEKRSRDNFAKLKAAEPKLAELDQIKAQSQTVEQRQAEELARWQSEAEKWRTSAVGNRIQALASDFADPTDATGALSDQSKYLDAGGQINEDAIKADLAEVLERKPHWRRPEAGSQASRLPAPNYAQGSGGKPTPNPAAEFGALVQGALRGS